jgi:hypothetical protein
MLRVLGALSLRMERHGFWPCPLADFFGSARRRRSLRLRFASFNRARLSTREPVARVA